MNNTQDLLCGTAAPAAAATSALTVYYDGGCPVCAREVAGYRRQPGAEACVWVDASQCDDSAFGSGLTREAALQRLHVRRADGGLADGVLGFAALWMALPRLAWLGRLAAWPPLTRLLDVAYGLFLAVRPLWRR
jgi:predicted DCC family thiol-disulfide oxidoreductase YuxK